MSRHDVVIVGSGINSLVCAAMLAKRGCRVCVLEREPVLGGCIRTEELTVNGFRHDTLSTLYPLFVTAPHFPLLQGDLERFGVRFVNTDLPTAVVRSDRCSLVFARSREKNIAELAALCADDGAAYASAMQEIERFAPLTFGMLGGEPLTRRSAGLLFKQFWNGGAQSLAEYFGSALLDCRSWLEGAFRSDLARALFAPWVLHVGLGPESAASALMGKLIMFTLEAAGSPMVVGGGANLVSGFASLIRSLGGELHTDADVERILVDGMVARGVRLVDGREFLASDAVVCNVTPTQLYGRLLSADRVPLKVRSQASRFRYGRGEMQIHLALNEPPQWADERLGRVAMLHVTDGIDAVSRAVNEAVRGLLPAQATIVVAQPTALDPSRAPPGKSILWIQLQELPSKIKGDAMCEIDCPADGSWTEAVRERYADRILQRLCNYIPNLSRSIIGRAVLSPADLQRININLVGGDPYSGSCELSQFMVWRPFSSVRNHATPVGRLFQIGASTHPGPGLGGMSGFMVAAAIA
jgi:phytoene dehydrogenase-like protein